jgi:ribosome modulation factor
MEDYGVLSAYELGYAAGITGCSIDKGLAGSERYMRGYNAGIAQWEHYLNMARGMA